MAALAWRHVFGFGDATAVTKRIPESRSRSTRICVRPSFAAISPATAAVARAAEFATSSREIASGLGLLLGSYGVCRQHGRAPRRERQAGDGLCVARRSEKRHAKLIVTATREGGSPARIAEVWAGHKGAANN